MLNLFGEKTYKLTQTQIDFINGVYDELKQRNNDLENENAVLKNRLRLNNIMKLTEEKESLIEEVEKLRKELYINNATMSAVLEKLENTLHSKEVLTLVNRTYREIGNDLPTVSGKELDILS